MQLHNIKKRTSGFTLLELLLAITIFSIISTITYSGLKIVLDAERQISEHMERLSKLQICLSLMQRDMEQAVNRAIRNEFGDTLDTLIGGEKSDLFIEFTRGGYPNPMQLPRSSLQRIGYQLEDGVLYRISWQVLDRAPDSTSKKIQLLENITSIKLTYFDQQMKPVNQWPPADLNGGDETQNPLPKAIELNLEIEKIGKIRRLFRVAEMPTIST